MSYLPRFDTEFAPKLGKRAKTFRLMFELLDAMDHPPIIVETGSIRELGCWEGDGCSTLVFDDYASHRKGTQFATVDINHDHRRLAANNCKTGLTYCQDSIYFLSSIVPERVIDLLYLDSYDFDPENPHPSSLHHLKELAAAQKNLRPGSIIAVDDNHPNGVGKGAYVRDYLHNIGIEPIADDYQVVWVWK